MPSGDPVIDSVVVPMLVIHLRSRGTDPATLLDRAGIAAEALDLPRPAKVRVSQVRQLVEDTADVLRDPHLGLTLAELLPPGYFGVAEMAARSAATVGAALSRFGRYSRLLTPSDTRITCRETADAFVLRYTLDGVDAPFVGRHVNELTLALFLRFTEQVAASAKDISVLRVRFANAGPRDRAPCARRFRTEALVFDAEENELWLARRTAEAGTRESNDAMLATLDAQASDLLARSVTREPFVRELERAILESLRDGEPSVSVVAKRLGVGGRTLQRRLQEQGIVFREKADHLRYAIAREHLASSTLSVTEIAFLLGYADGRAFARAFQRWSGGVPPLRFRAAESSSQTKG